MRWRSRVVWGSRVSVSTVSCVWDILIGCVMGMEVMVSVIVGRVWVNGGVCLGAVVRWFGGGCGRIGPRLQALVQ